MEMETTMMKTVPKELLAGLHGKERSRAYMRLYMQANKDRYKEYFKKYYVEHKEAMCAANKRNREKRKAMQEVPHVSL